MPRRRGGIKEGQDEPGKGEHDINDYLARLEIEQVGEVLPDGTYQPEIKRSFEDQVDFVYERELEEVVKALRASIIALGFDIAGERDLTELVRKLTAHPEYVARLTAFFEVSQEKIKEFLKAYDLMAALFKKHGRSLEMDLIEELIIKKELKIELNQIIGIKDFIEKGMDILKNSKKMSGLKEMKEEENKSQGKGPGILRRLFG